MFDLSPDFITLRLRRAALDTALAKPQTKAMTAVCIAAQTIASVNCPVKTGRLRASIDYVVVTEGEGQGRTVGYVGSNVEYARFVELGTSRQAAQPYLRPALYAVQQAGGGAQGGLVA